MVDPRTTEHADMRLPDADILQYLEQLDREFGEDRESILYAHELLSYLNTHPQSSSLPPNPSPVTEAFQDYPQKIELLEASLARDNSADRKLVELKTDFLHPDDPNVGWKFHLNIAPSDVASTYEYLSENRYRFKYMAGLHGGHRPPPGKVFTVYVGSFAKTTEIAPVLSSELAAVLKRPEAEGDIEFAPGIVGRFCALNARFTYYGPIGIQLLAGLRAELLDRGATEPLLPQYEEKVRMQSLRILMNENYGYGKYFLDVAA